MYIAHVFTEPNELEDFGLIECKEFSDVTSAQSYLSDDLEFVSLKTLLDTKSLTIGDDSEKLLYAVVVEENMGSVLNGREGAAATNSNPVTVTFFEDSWRNLFRIVGERTIRGMDNDFIYLALCDDSESQNELLKKILSIPQDTPKKELPPPMRSTYAIKNWAHWDREIDEAVADFRTRAGVAPSIFIAAEQTHRRMDIAANSRRQKILGPDRSPVPAHEEFVVPSAFRGSDYELEFCMDESLPLDHFILVFDSDPDGGLPLPDHDNLPLPAPVRTSNRKRAVG